MVRRTTLTLTTKRPAGCRAAAQRRKKPTCARAFAHSMHSVHTACRCRAYMRHGQLHMKCVEVGSEVPEQWHTYQIVVGKVVEDPLHPHRCVDAAVGRLEGLQ